LALGVGHWANEHASLVYSTTTNLYTLTFVNGTSKTFNSSGYLTAITDRNSNQTAIAYDTSSRITRVTAPGGQALTFTYGMSSDPNRATSIQDSVGNVATYTYSNSLLTQAAYPDGGQLNYAYDANSNITTVTDSLGKNFVNETHCSLPTEQHHNT
jgi:YD repeat-containing protein